MPHPARAHHAFTTGATLIGGYLGYVLAAWGASVLTSTSDSLNTLFLTGAGIGAGFLAGYTLRERTQRAYDRLRARVTRIPSEIVIATVLGSSIGLTFAVMLNTFLGQVPGFAWPHGLLIGLLGIVTFTSLTVHHRAAFTPTKSEPAPTPDVLLDTSAIIDGRIKELLTAGLSDHPPAVPTRVLDELQNLADSHHASRHARGSRGLSNLQALQADGASITPVRDTLPPHLATDIVLAELALQHDATLLTVDYNLTRAARLRGARVLNLNELAHALRPTWTVGDEISVHFDESGTAPDQATGHLDDGTLVVLRNGSQHIGQVRLARIHNVLERPSGRVIFADDAGPMSAPAA